MIIHGYHKSLQVFGAVHDYGEIMVPLLANRIGYRNYIDGKIIDGWGEVRAENLL